MSAVTTDSLIRSLRRSGLVDAHRLDEWLAQHPQLPQSPKELAELLIEQRMLTGFQSRLLLKGKSKNFIISGKYKLLGLLGEGGMGRVYLCEHVLLRRKVALKVLPLRRSDDSIARERFYREARAVAALDHPNIVRAHDIDSDEGVPYLVMEFVEGISLQKLVERSGPLDMPLATNCVAQAAAGLQNAHEHGWIHRDVKPANLLLDRSGTLKVLDLGLARLFADTDGSVTEKFNKDTILGTVDYLSPEQAVRTGAIDIRADIYALGATFYFLLTGHPPFPDGNPAQKLIAHQSRPPQPIHEFRDDVPDGIAAILYRMLAKKPADRFQEPAQVAEALLEFSTAANLPDALYEALHETIPELSLGPTQSSTVKPDSERTRSALMSTSHSIRPVRKSGGTTALMPTSPAKLPRWQIALAALAGAAIAVGSALIGATIIESRNPESLQGSVFVPVAGVERLIVGHSGAIYGLDISPDGQRLLSGSLDMTVRLWDLAQGNELQRLSGPTHYVMSAVMIPNSKLAAASGYERIIRIWNAETGEPERELTGHQGIIPLICPLPDGKRLISASWDKTLKLWDVHTGELLRTFEGHQKGVYAVAVAPDGKRAISGGGDNEIRVWDVETGECLAIMPGHTDVVRSLAISPDGKYALSGGFDYRIFMWDLETLTQVREFEGSKEIVEFVSFSPNGRFAVSTEGPQFRDGKEWLGPDQGVRLWDVSTGKQLYRWGGIPNKVFTAIFTPDGTRIVTGAGDTYIRIFNVPAEFLTAPISQSR